MGRGRAALAGAAFLLACSSCATAPEGDGGLARAKVVRVIDGDTLEVRLAGGALDRVRLIGIDTPEISGRRAEPYARVAASSTRVRVEGRTVWLERDAQVRDRYGRMLAYVWLAPPRDARDPDPRPSPAAAPAEEREVREAMLNALLVLDGYAQTLTVPPNVRYVAMFRRFQSEAREAHRGLWRRSPARP